ncbi:hypothetical protein R1sor_016426 [Riccia sorocarpa]|uniref:CCHC-type domain-containing protein n=1 Tax=Riccia sorocarpa TaxID=122646 RepID=A0ABD3HI73_9MARC
MSLRRGVRVVQVKALAKREFLILFASEGKSVVMARPPNFLDGKVIRFVEWGNRHKEKLLPHLKAVWVELRDVPPFLEDQATNTLEAIGKVAYQAVDKQVELRYANVRGCLLMDLAQELPRKVGLRTPWQKVYLQPITYTRLPDHCFICMQRGHWARSCPSRKPPEDREEGRQEEDVQGHADQVGGQYPGQNDGQLGGFIPVRRRIGSKSPSTAEPRSGTKAANENRFIVLEDKEEAETLGDGHEEGQEDVQVDTKALNSKNGYEMEESMDESQGEDEELKESLAEYQMQNGSEGMDDNLWTLQLEVEEAPAEGQVVFYQEGLPAMIGPENNLQICEKTNLFATGQSVLKMDQSTQQGLEEPMVFADGIDQEGFGRAPKMKEGEGVLSSQSHTKRGGKKKPNQLKEDTLLQLSDGLSSKRRTLCSLDLKGCRQAHKPINFLEMDEHKLRIVVRGREERLWRSMVGDKGLVDGYFCSASIQGPRFTRFAKRNNRIDFSRLDRFYVTDGVGWLDHIKEICHDAHTALSDHVPIVGSFQLVPEVQGRKPENYFKFNHYELKDPEVFRKGERNRKAQQRKEEGSLAKEVEWHRSQLGSEPSEAEYEVLQRLEKRLKDQELQEARIWRLRCREKWMSEDDASSRYFFAKLKAKWARDSINALEIEGGEVTGDQELILGEIQKFYQCLYTKEEESGERANAREEVMSLIQNKITPTESTKVSCVPEEEEIWKVVFAMKHNKAPRGDGLTVEVVKQCWGFAGTGCVKMVKAVWIKKRLLKADMQGIVKLIHKGGCRKKEVKKLESICRDFLWGSTPEGKSKKALVAWSHIVKEKYEGGLSFQTFESRARALQMRYVTEILEGQKNEWLGMLRKMAWLMLLTGVQKLERSKWTYSDAMLLLPSFRMTQAPTVDKLLQVWFVARKFLEWPSDEVTLPGQCV